jgi:hypothetical protein
MARPAQLTATAIIALIGSGIALAAGMIALATPNHRRSISILVIVAGAWGISTAIGILRRWRWVRLSILIFAGLTAYAGASVAPVLAFIRTPVRPGALPLAEPRPLLFCIGIVMAAFGLWWVVLFSGNRTKEYFGVHVATDPTPLSFSVIGWYLVATGALGLLNLLRTRHHPPSMHFGFVFTGWQAVAAALFYSAIALYPGIGLLRHKRQSPRLAIYYGLFQVVDIVAFLFRPDRDARVSEYNSARAASIPATVSQFPATSLLHLLQLSSIEWGILTLVAVWFLSIHKKAFAVMQESLQQSKREDLSP